LFLSTIPITVLMNSIRIGIIGVTVEYWGIEMAEGFLHDFEGWVIFMTCLGVLAIEMWCFHYFSRHDGGFMDRLNLDGPEQAISLADIQWSAGGARPFIAATVLLVLASLALPMLDDRQEPVLERTSFDQFPLYHSGWIGREQAIGEEVLDELQLTDYIMANYKQGQRPPVNFYVAYYASQRKGASIHSPKSCLPGGGWRLSGIGEKTIEGLTNSQGEPLVVNRALMRMGDSAQIVYYWFEQRGRNITSEYAAKWYMFTDALTMNRSDGALLRVVVPVADIANIDEAEATADQFLKDFYPLIPEYIPDGGEQ
jgi:exosortase D (VPLPA-CTERM-specific)